MATPRLLVIQHADDCPPGWFGEWLGKDGVDVRVLPAHRGWAIPAQLGDHSGLMVLGGSMGAGDDRDHRWLTPTKALIATTVAARMPFLGVCLGHQLAAVALGGEVRPNPRGRTRGLTPYAPTAQGRRDELLGGVRPGTLALHYNNDVVTVLPDNAVEVATAPDGTCQAARFGRYAWGVQFHPEATPGMFERWVQTDRPGPDGTPDDDGALLTARVLGHESQLRRSWAPVARRFAQVLSAAAGDPA